MPNLFGPFLVAALVALVSGSLLIPILRRLKAGQSISTDAPKSHAKKAGTPTMGGAIILVGALVPTLIYPRPSGDLRLLFGVTLATVAFGLIGFLDDYLIIRRGKNLGLRAREKLAGQVVVALAFAGWYWWTDPSGRNIGQALVEPGRLLLLGYHVLLMVGMSNAVNLTDGLDGLAAGVSLPVWIALAVMAGLGIHTATWLGGGIGDQGLVIFCIAFAGATLGYIWFNAHPAQVFMGDTGSLAIGGGMAAAAIALGLEWALLIVALVHLAEAASVTIQVISFKTTGKRIFKMAPLHHHFELCEQPETRIVARFAIASALCAALGLALYFRA